MIIESDFKPAWWMTNPHIQTIYSSLRHPLDAPIDKRERIDLPDGDFLDLVWGTGGLPPTTPLLIILHGLGGGADSSYVARFMKVFNDNGWRAVLMEFRGASKELNRLPRAYHSGETSDLDFIVRLLEEREPYTHKGIVGISLGGNILLKWLGEQGPQQRVKAAVAVSVPYVLNQVANKMNEGFTRFYQNHMLNQFKSIFARKLDYMVNPPEALKKAAECNCFWTFDAQVTAPLNGFSSVHAYYRQCSSRQYLCRIETPTLLIHAEDDPFMTIDVLPTAAELSEHVVLELSKRGGHVGFITGNTPGVPVYWLDERISAYFNGKFVA